MTGMGSNPFFSQIEKSFSDYPLAEKSKEFSAGKIDKATLDKPIAKNPEATKNFREAREANSETDCSDTRNCPIEDGQWEGKRGGSKWIPAPDFVPKKSNPEGKTWTEILKKYGIDGIEFKDGEPIFDDISKGTVKIEGFSSSRDDNFDKADLELAKQRGCSPEEVKKWRKENGYTWHECKDMRTMQKVPSEVHNNIPHRGGVSSSKSLGN